MYENVRGNFIPSSSQLEKPNSPSVLEWLSRLWNIPTIEYSTAERKNELLLYVTTWINQAGIMLKNLDKKGCKLYVHIHEVQKQTKLTCDNRREIAVSSLGRYWFGTRQLSEILEMFYILIWIRVLCMYICLYICMCVCAYVKILQAISIQK